MEVLCWHSDGNIWESNIFAFPHKILYLLTKVLHSPGNLCICSQKHWNIVFKFVYFHHQLCCHKQSQEKQVSSDTKDVLTEYRWRSEEAGEWIEVMSNTECHGWELNIVSFTDCKEIVSPGEQEPMLEDRRSSSGKQQGKLDTGKCEWSWLLCSR